MESTIKHNDAMDHLRPSLDEVLMKKILQTHMPDGRRGDATPLLYVAEKIIHCVTEPKLKPTKSIQEPFWADDMRDNGIGSRPIGIDFKELGVLIYHASHEMLSKRCKEQSSHATTILLLELLGSHLWGTKAVVVLAALAMSYGKFWLIMQQLPTNALALSIAMLKGVADTSDAINVLRKGSKALRCLFDKMVEVTKCIIEFEMLPMQFMVLDYEAAVAMMMDIRLSSYLVIRSAVAGTSQIASINYENLNSTAATWELWSLVCKISHTHKYLQTKLDVFYLHMEKKTQSKLFHVFEEDHADNQNVLSTLLALKDDYPLRFGSLEAKVGVDVLRNKVVMLFISSLDICLEKLILIFQQLQDNTHNTQESCYEVIWVPIAKPNVWCSAKKKAFSQMLDILPWYSLREPSKLSQPVVNFFHEVWHFKGDPLMVVLDCKGKVRTLNAVDMITIWGLMAYPFSTSRECELWKEQSWTMETLVDEIDPILSYWIEDGRIICLCGSNNLDWVREVASKIKDIGSKGILLEMIYVGCKDIEHTRDVVRTIIAEKFSHLSVTMMCVFWLRLNSMRSSKLRLGSALENDDFFRGVDCLLGLESGNQGWLLVGEGSPMEILLLCGDEVLKCLSLFHVWGEYVDKLGFLGAMRKALGHPTADHCNQYTIVPHVEGVTKRSPVCSKCKRLMEKYTMYQCMTT